MRKLILPILMLFLTNSVFGQEEFILVSKPMSEYVGMLPKFDNFLITVTKKNGKPYKEVEVFINDKKIGLTNEVGVLKQQIVNNSSSIKLLFKKGNKQLSKSVHFSPDSIYTINIVLSKPKYSILKINSSPLDMPVYEHIKDSKNLLLLNAFVLRFPNSKYKTEGENKIEELFYNEAITKKTISAYQSYLLIYPEGEYKEQCEKEYDGTLFENAKQQSTMLAYKNYIDESPYDLKKSNAELEAYRIAQSKDTKYAYSEYINLFPSSSYVNDATQNINRIKQAEEDSAYKKALNGDISACNSYLTMYANGRYVLEIKERYDYLSAKSNNDIDLLENFKKTYPNSEYITDIDNLIIASATTEEDCQNIVNKFPDLSTKIAEKKVEIKEIEQAEKQELERKAESELFQKAIYGTIADCSEYLRKYPTGSFVKEIETRKLNLQNKAAVENRQKNEIKVSQSEYEKFSKSAMRGELDAVKEYVNSGKQIEPGEDIDFMSALSTACFTNEIEIVKYLIENGADVNAVYKLNNTVYTPLKIAGSINQTKTTNIEMVKLLLNSGADPNFKFEDGTTAVDFIIGAGQISEIAPLLFEKNYNPNYLATLDNITLPPIALLVGDDNVEMVKYFVEHGAYVNVKVEVDGSYGTLLDVAEIENASYEMKNLLKSYGVRNYSSSNNQTRYITVGDIVNFFSSDNNSSQKVQNTTCWDESSIKKWDVLECDGHKYTVYKVTDNEGSIHHFYYWGYDVIGLCGGTKGYYEHQIGPDSWLGKDRTTALKKLCGCE